MLINRPASPQKTALPPAQRGFTLIEVVIAILIFGISMLGLASLQVVGMKVNDTSYRRSQAVLQAYNMSDRMRANIAAVDDGYYNNVSGISTPSSPSCQSSGCTPQELAEHDVYEWNRANQNALPMGAGTVTFNSSTSTFTIAVRWDDNKDGSFDSNDPTFSIEFRP